MLLYRIFRFLLTILCKIFFGLEVCGKEFIPKRGGFVLVSNHASLLDPILLGVSCPRILNFAAKDSLFSNPLFAVLLRRVGAFPIKRWSADLSAVRESVRRLKEGRGLVVFPEGTRSTDNQIKDLSAGFIFLAHKAGVPVVPARIYGSSEALAKGRRMIKPIGIRVIFGRSFSVQGDQAHSDILKDIHRQISMLGRI